MARSSSRFSPVESLGDARTSALQRDVAVLASEIGERNLRADKQLRALVAAREYIAAELARAGYRVRRQHYWARGVAVENLEVELRGTDLAHEIVVIGAHYDTVTSTNGANDNASGVAALLAAARSAAAMKWFRRTVRFVAFCTEEPPFTRTTEMGSWVYARECRRRGEPIVAMLSLETLGYYADAARATHAPFPLNHGSPWRPDFVAVVGNLSSRSVVARVVEAMRQVARLRCKGASLPGMLPGVGSSDHWSFWKEGYSAAMLTDTAWLRYRHYHRPTDTVEKLDYVRLSRATIGVDCAVESLATSSRR